MNMLILKDENPSCEAYLDGKQVLKIPKTIKLQFALALLHAILNCTEDKVMVEISITGKNDRSEIDES